VKLRIQTTHIEALVHEEMDLAVDGNVPIGRTSGRDSWTHRIRFEALCDEETALAFAAWLQRAQEESRQRTAPEEPTILPALSR
jgi:hypothetical protein